jgi:small glutamine-rich tetratricopeptide repeat-containing protein alpha
MKKGYETAKRRCEEEGVSPELDTTDSRSGPGGAGAGAGGMPDLSSLAGMLGGGGGGAGGMPDLGALMQNPMMRQMASQMMSNPDMMNNLMSRFGGAGGAGGAGGMPDLSSMMNDPAIAEMARNFMGGMGGQGGAGRGQ